jgi:hypothetical protein
MCRIGESGTMCGFGNAGASHQFPGGPLQPEAENIGSQGDTDRLRKNVHEARARQPGNVCEILQRRFIRNSELLVQEPGHAFDAWMYPG